MKKYIVYKMVSYDQQQMIEANSPEEAIELAEEYNEWDDPIETNYDFDAHEIKDNA
jgi:hypothetical protein